MSADTDDEALSWDGAASDPTHVEAPATEAEPEDADETAPGTSSALLIVYGIFGGVTLLYIVGWIIGIQRGSIQSGNPFFDFMTTFGEILAIVAPAAWFFVVLWFTAGRRPIVRILWLLGGIVLLVPLPFVFGLGA